MQVEAGGKSATHKNWAVSFAAIVLAMMTMQMSSLGFSPLIPAMKEAWHMDYTQVGTFTGVYGLVAMIMSVPAGILAKRYGEKRILSVGLTLSALGLLAVSLSDNYLEGLSSRATWIFGYRMAFVSVMTGVALTAPHAFRGKAMGILGAMAALATVLGAPFASSLGAELGWRHAMQGFAAAAMVGVVVFLVFYRQAPVAPREERRGPGIFSAFRIPVVWVIPLLGLTNAAGFAATFFLPSVVTSQFGMTAAQGAVIISIAYGVAIFVNPACGWLADRFNRWHVMAAIVAAMIPACLAMNSGNIVVFSIATTILVSFGHAATNQIYPTAAELLRGRDVGPLMGVVALGGGLFGYLGPQLLGWLRQISGGFALGWAVMTAGTTLIFVILLLLKRYVDRNNANESAKTA